jgi:haloalkane dehalogenase
LIFLGWGRSDKPAGYPYTTPNQVGDLDAVITQLKLGPVILVAHDASGPPAIDWALEHPSVWPGWCCTYYCEMPTVRRPEAIWLFSTPVVRSVARPVSRLLGNWLFRQMYRWQIGGSSETRMSGVSLCRCCINSSTPRRVPNLPSLA